MAHPSELDVHDLSRPREGDVDAWVRWAVGLACLVTFLIAVVVPRVLRPHGEGTVFDGFWFRNGLALAVGGVIAFGCMPLGRVSPAVRLAVVLPLLHLGLMIVAWIGWTLLSSRMSTAVVMVPVLDAAPLGWVFGAVAATIAIAGAWIGRARRGEAIHAIVMIALVALLLMGLWLPIASWFVTDRGLAQTIPTWGVEFSRWEHVKAQLESPARLAAIMLMPPLVAAIGYTLIAIRRRNWLTRLRRPLIAVLSIAWVLTIDLRRAATDVAAIVYSNFVPWLLAVAAAALAAITALTVATWLGGRRRRAGTWRQHTGRIAADRGELVAGYEITSWLRGPRAITSACEVVTAGGTLPVPAGAHLIAPLPLATTLLRTGERVAVLRGGDEVALGGYEQHATGQPFRDSGAPIPGEHGVAIGPRSADGGGQLALVAWRPCIAYLIIVVVVAAPALITALQPM